MRFPLSDEDLLDNDRLRHLTHRIIGCAIEVHRHLGPGLPESMYQRSLGHELTIQGIVHRSQVPVPIVYKGLALGHDYKADFLVEEEVVVEIKATDRHHPAFDAQLLGYLRMLDKRLGLLINFNVEALHQGVRRMIDSR